VEIVRNDQAARNVPVHYRNCWPSTGHWLLFTDSYA